MSGDAHSLLTDLPKGHRFPETGFDVPAERVLRYLAALGDGSAVYAETGVAPPLAVAAFGLAAILESVQLPPGTLHTSQEMDVRSGVPVGASVTLDGSVAQRSERAGLVISVIEFAVTVAGATAPALLGRTTVMAPAGAPSGASA